MTSLVPVRFAQAMGADVVIAVDIYCLWPARRRARDSQERVIQAGYEAARAALQNHATTRQPLLPLSSACPKRKENEARSMAALQRVLPFVTGRYREVQFEAQPPRQRCVKWSAVGQVYGGRAVMISSPSRTPVCRNIIDPAPCPESPHVALFSFAEPLLTLWRPGRVCAELSSCASAARATNDARNQDRPLAKSASADTVICKVPFGHAFVSPKGVSAYGSRAQR